MVCSVNLICGSVDGILAEIMDEVVGIRGIDQKWAWLSWRMSPSGNRVFGKLIPAHPLVFALLEELKTVLANTAISACDNIGFGGGKPSGMRMPNHTDLYLRIELLLKIHVDAIPNLTLYRRAHTMKRIDISTALVMLLALGGFTFLGGCESNDAGLELPTEPATTPIVDETGDDHDHADGDHDHADGDHDHADGDHEHADGDHSDEPVKTGDVAAPPAPAPSAPAPPAPAAASDPAPASTEEPAPKPADG